MVIKEGYDGKPTKLRIVARPLEIVNKGVSRATELWVEMYDVREGAGPNDTYETLHYMTLEELLALRDECNAAIKELVGL